jgi:hypothetical protein
MSVKRTTFFIAGLLMLVSGCASPGTLVFRQNGDELPKLGKAPVDGTYDLFVAGQSQELFSFQLKKDEALGFQSDTDGTVQWLYMIAGSRRHRLDLRQTYEWRLQPEEQTAEKKGS